MHKEYGSINQEKGANYVDNEYVSINGKKVFKNFIYDDEKDQVEIVYYSKTDKNKFLLELECQGLSFLIIPLNI